MADYKIAVLKGDGVGPEVCDAAIDVLEALSMRYGRSFEYVFPIIGGVAVELEGAPLPQSTVDACKSCDGILAGAVGAPKWDNLAGHLRPEKGLLSLRAALGLFANIRPIVLYEEMKAVSPLRSDIVKNGMDIMFVREMTGGIYFGDRGFKSTAYGKAAYDTEIYSTKEIERVAYTAFQIASARRKKVTSVDKANLLESSRLWRATTERVAKSFPAVKFESMYVDTFARNLIGDPSEFDVVLSSNLFGEILSNEAATLAGSVGLLPSSSLGEGKLGIYGPIHGSAPILAGTDRVNPIGAILSAAMMLSTSLDFHEGTLAVENAVKKVLVKGLRTDDIYHGRGKRVSCSEMTDAIVDAIVNA